MMEREIKAIRPSQTRSMVAGGYSCYWSRLVVGGVARERVWGSIKIGS